MVSRSGKLLLPLAVLCAFAASGQQEQKKVVPVGSHCPIRQCEDRLRNKDQWEPSRLRRDQFLH